MRGPALLAGAALLCGTASADEVFLKGGGQLSGRVVSRTATKVEVDVGAGRISVPTSSVVRIEEGRSQLQQYEERAGALAAADADGWIALAQWAEAKGLGTQAREAYHRALAASPTDARANEALGNVQLNGRWVSEDEGYRARGYVKLEGEWMTTAEQETILRERAAQDERDRARREAEARTREAQARAEEAEARAREAEARAQQTTEESTSDGIPLWYAWGGGPAYWPSRPAATPPVAPPSRPAARPGAVPR
jgi:hypothetical protein